MKGNKMRRIKGRKHTFPIARSPLSKKKMIPKNEKNIPNPVKPRPISDPNEYSQFSESEQGYFKDRHAGYLEHAIPQGHGPSCQIK